MRSHDVVLDRLWHRRTCSLRSAIIAKQIVVVVLDNSCGRSSVLNRVCGQRISSNVASLTDSSLIFNRLACVPFLAHGARFPITMHEHVSILCNRIRLVLRDIVVTVIFVVVILRLDRRCIVI